VSILRPGFELCVNKPIFVSEKITADNYLPKNASQLLRYYDFWNRPYIEWSLNEFSEHLRKFYNINEKSLIHNSFKKDGEVLKKLFSKEHPVQLRFLELENQLKSQQIKRKKKKAKRRKFIGKSIRCELLKEKIEIAKDSEIINGYNRINEHYDDFHSQDSDQYDFGHGNVM
ncbi:39131_t:CDS:2, partial [Gigaspora margarita]